MIKLLLKPTDPFLQAQSCIERGTRGKRLHQEAIDLLKAWSRWSNDYGEICRATGKSKQSWLGRAVSKAHKENNIHKLEIGMIQFTSDEMIAVDKVVKSLSDLDRKMIHFHYVVVAPIGVKLKKLNISKTTYYRYLDSMHLQFIAAGGIV